MLLVAKSTFSLSLPIRKMDEGGTRGGMVSA